MKIHVYNTVSRYGSHDFVSRVGGTEEFSFICGGISELAKELREKVWWSSSPSPAERLRQDVVYITFDPPADIEYIPGGAPNRCYKFSETNQEIFWRIFSRDQAEAGRLRLVD